MDNGVLLALILKAVDEKLQREFDDRPSLRGPRGHRGADGADGKSFVFEEHEEKIKSWAKEFALKFSDLTPEEVESLKGEQGPKGEDGKSFSWTEHRQKIADLVCDHVTKISPELKLKFSDLTEEEKESLRGPRGQRGKPGKDFIFEEHKEFFNTLKLRYSDLTQEEKDGLKLKFNSLTPDEKNELRLKYSDLSESEKESLRGPRGQRGRSGKDGEKGDKGDAGEKGDRGLQGLRGERGARGPQGVAGVSGISGRDGVDGKDGKDAPWVTDIELEEDGKRFSFIFRFSDGTTLRTNDLKLPKSVEIYIAGGGIAAGGGGNSGGGSGSDFEFLSGTGVPSSGLGVNGNLYLDDTTGDLYKKVFGSWTLIDNLTGPQGPAGPGSDFEFLFGSGSPDNILGVDDNVYLDNATGDIYKKIAGAWVYQTTLGGGGTNNEILYNVDCASDVFVGAVVRLIQDNPTFINMDEWTNLSLVTTLNIADYAVLANLAQADSYERANAIGIVFQKPTSTTCNIIKSGPTPDLFFGLDVTKEYFLSPTAAGILTTIAPTVPGQVIMSIGKPVSSKKLEVILGDRIERA